MTDQEKQILSNLATICRNSKLTADEHDYFNKALQYVADKLEAHSEQPEQKMPEKMNPKAAAAQHLIKFEALS